MTKEFSYLSLCGTIFSPAQTERETGLVFSMKNEPGEIGERGRYRGKPYPFGHAILKAPDGSEAPTGLDRLLDLALVHVNELKKIDFLEGVVHVDYAYNQQCNLEFKPETLAKLARLGFALTITCYQDESQFKPEIGTFPGIRTND
jgi:hypothetical protein